MAYIGKFIDRSPKISPAGVCKYECKESVKRTLVDLNTDYSDYAIKEQRQHKSYPLPPLFGDPYAGYETKMKKLLQSEETSIFKNLIQEFKETRYKSYWNKRLGRCRDPIPGLPHNIDPETHCFGRKIPEGLTVGDLINPKKTDEEIIVESETGHELYVQTHKDYYAGEQVDRK